MRKRIFFLLFLVVFLASCNSSTPPNTPSNLASLCQILRTRLEAVNFETQDQSTMKRKNPVDQAELLREYYSYDCPGIVDFTPPP